MNSEFSFFYTGCWTKVKEPSLPYYLPRAGGRIIRFIPFPRVLVLCEMQSTSSGIWVCVTIITIIPWAPPRVHQMNRVFGNGLGDWGSVSDQVIPKTQKMILDAALHYRVSITGKVEQSKEWSSALLYTLVW